LGRGASGTLVPQIEWSRGFLAVFMGILGTTISPYLFPGRLRREWKKNEPWGAVIARRKGSTDEELANAARTC